MTAAPPFSANGVFYVTDSWFNTGTGYVGMIAGNNTLSIAQQNADVLQAIIDLAQSGQHGGCPSSPYGATIVFPGHSTVPSPIGGGGPDAGAEYFLAVPADATVNAALRIDCNWPLKFAGTGNVKLVMVVDNEGNTGDMFQIGTNSAGDNVGGITFEDLELRYPQFIEGGVLQVEPYAAIHVVPDGAENIRIVRMVFTDCPVSVKIENGLNSVISQCMFNYTANGNIGTSIILGDTTGDAVNEVYIDGCLFYADDGPPGSTGLVIYGAEHVKMSDCRLDSFLNGIQIIPGPGKNTVRCTFTAIAIYTGTSAANVLGQCVLIQPQIPPEGSDAAQIAQIVFQGCFFEMGETATPVAPGGPGVLVDANNPTGTNQGIVDNVRFISCYVTRWPGPGLQVRNGVTNLEVLGGFYAGNNYKSVTSQPYGIWIQQAIGVRIVGVSCIGEYEWVTVAKAQVTYQQAIGIYIDSEASSVLIGDCDVSGNSSVGIYVAGGAQDVIIDSCDVTANMANGIAVAASSSAVSNVAIRNCNASGYSGGYNVAINVTTSGTNTSTLQVTNCAGYNDQSVPLTHSYPSGGLANFHGYSLGYYGPLEFYVVGGSVTISSIKVGTVTTGLLQGSFFLMPGEDAIIAWTPPTGTLTIPAIGK